MWVLSNDGDVLQGRTIWLRPGKKYLFGRQNTEPGQLFSLPNEKTISRTHITVEVDPVEPGDCANPKARSKVTLIDQKTKIGTYVNGEQIQKIREGKVLDRDENEIRLGRFEHLFRINWVPVTLTFTYVGAERKANPYPALYETFSQLDMKVLTEYQHGVTTHLVSKKRNTSKVLQALLDGKYIVNEEPFIAALLEATTQPEDSSKKAPLENDFILGFPDPLEFIPPRGNEKTQRDTSDYTPNSARQDLFEGYTFIFYDQRQFENLLAPITDGRGKALFREVKPHETDFNDFVRYVKSVAGEKGLGEFEDGSAGKGVVVVRYNSDKASAGIQEWYAEFGRRVAISLDHRLIEQSEFLDAILGCDASVLRRPLEQERSNAEAPASSMAAESSQQHPQMSQESNGRSALQIPAAGSVTRVGRSRRAIASIFKGFDDFEETTLKKESEPAQDVPMESQSQGLFVPENAIMETDREAPPTTRKRSTPPALEDSEEEEDIMEQMAPAAAAIKRRRLADDLARQRRGETTFPVPARIEMPVIPKSPPRNIKREINVLEVAREKREEAEAIARAEREALEAAMDGMDIEAIRNLAIIEEMEIGRAVPPPQSHGRIDEGERWDDRWNGRKNFKKFRRRGDQGSGQGTTHRVIVQLEEVKKKDFGIGEDYWLDEDADNRRRRDKDRATRQEGGSNSIATVPIDSSLIAVSPQPGRGSRARGTQAAERAAELLNQTTDSPTGLLTGVNENHNENDNNNDPDVDEGSNLAEVAPSTTRAGGRKRRGSASTLAKAAPPPKKAKAAAGPVASTSSGTSTRTARARAKAPAPIVIDNSDDSEDELKFRFRKR